MESAWIIEDLAENVRRAGDVLTALGVTQIEVKRNIPMALAELNALLEQNQPLPKLIILDLVFGPDSGFEVLRLWHSTPRFNAETKVVVWTVLGTSEEWICRAFGVKNFVSKWDGNTALEHAVASTIE